MGLRGREARALWRPEGSEAMKGLYDIPEPPLEPPEAEPVCRCAYCGDEIYEGNRVYRCDEGTLHAECVLGHIAEVLSRAEIAVRCGYREGVAGRRDG